MEKSCRLCPRECGAVRKNAPGFCGCTDRILVASAQLHLWEEPCICKAPGCGAVFFSGCPLRCVFCQNHEISQKACGKEFSVEELSELFLFLQNEKSASCIDLVSPTPFAPEIAKALKTAKENGLHIPAVYNTSGYEKPETLKVLEGLADIYLPDLKYFSADLSRRYSSAPNYFEIAKNALSEMFRQTGAARWENGFLKKGVIVRHLVLPGAWRDSIRLLDFLFDRFGKSGIVLSLMSQYFPAHRAQDFPELNRKLTKLEYQKVVRRAEELGFEYVYTQSPSSADEKYVPDFLWKDL